MKKLIILILTCIPVIGYGQYSEIIGIPENEAIQRIYAIYDVFPSNYEINNSSRLTSELDWESKTSTYSLYFADHKDVSVYLFIRPRTINNLKSCIDYFNRTYKKISKLEWEYSDDKQRVMSVQLLGNDHAEVPFIIYITTKI